MDTIQLALFLEKYEILLEKAIAQVKENLPEDMKNVSKNLFGHEMVSYPILEPLEEVFSFLDDDVALLKKNSAQSQPPTTKS